MTGIAMYPEDRRPIKEAVREAVASGTGLIGAHLRGEDLSGINLTAANLTGAYLRSVNLANANLSGADLTGANLNCANLAQACLKDATLSYANLNGTILTDTDLTGAKIEQYIIVQLVGRATRSDAHDFLAFTTESGDLLIRAGCRTKTLQEFREHVKNYTNPYKIRETMEILNFLETCENTKD